jgi:peptide/nickel transport system permease protein
MEGWGHDHGSRHSYKTQGDEKVFVASQWQLIWWKFRKHRLAIIGSVVVIILYTLVLLCEFVSTE